MGTSVWSPLAQAARSGHAGVAHLLLVWGARVDPPTGAGVSMEGLFDLTPLMLAAMYGNADVVRLLLANDADFRARCRSGQTALQLAMIKPPRDYPLPKVTGPWMARRRKFAEEARRHRDRAATIRLLKAAEALRRREAR